MCLDAMRRHNRVARARRASRRPTPTGRLEILGYSGNMKIPLVKWSSAPLAARDCPKPGEAQRHTVIERRRDSFDARVVLTIMMRCHDSLVLAPPWSESALRRCVTA